MSESLDLSVLGYSGLKQYGGVIDEEWSSKLRGAYGQKVYREMSDSSSTLGAILFAIESLVRQVEWRVEPASTEDDAKDWARFLEECIMDMEITFEDFMSEILSCLPFGWAYFEIIYKLRKGNTKRKDTRSKYDDGKIGWRSFGLRPQDTLDRWEFDSVDDSLLGMHQWVETSGKTAFIPVEKAVLFRTKVSKNSPEGRSIFRNAVSDYYYHKRICSIEAIGIERDMTGLITMEVPVSILHPDAPAKEKTLLSNLQTMLGQLKRDEREYAIVPSETTPDGKPTGYKLKLLSTGGQRQINTSEVKKGYKVGMLQSVLAQFVELGMGNVGSFALASTQTDLFAVALGSFLDSFAATLNRDPVAKLMQLNGVATELWPKIVHGDLERVPLNEIGAYIQALASAGQLPDDEAIQRKLLEIAKLPIPAEEDNLDEEKTEKSKDVRKGFQPALAKAV
jgi:hypothetical protein